MSSVMELERPVAAALFSAEPATPPASPRNTKRMIRLQAITYLARDTAALELRPVDGLDLAPFSAGAHIDLALPNGLRRSYSLCNPQGESHRYVIGVKKAPDSRGGSLFIHEQIRVGATFEIAEPVNNFVLEEQAAHVVLIAGGIGITPIWSMVQRLVALDKPFELHYASRTRGDAAFLEELAALPEDYRRHVHLTFDHEPGASMLDLSTIVTRAPEGSHFYACGPAPMLDAFEKVTADLPTRQIHLERFAAPAPSTISRREGFRIELARSKQDFEVPENKAILDVLLDNGVDIPFSCMEGVCGSCRVAVLHGNPDHRDVALTKDEQASNKWMMVCCSRSRSDRLVLDL
jgi:ferredoxin-NADP reductase